MEAWGFEAGGPPLLSPLTLYTLAFPPFPPFPLSLLFLPYPPFPPSQGFQDFNLVLLCPESRSKYMRRLLKPHLLPLTPHLSTP